MPDHIFIELDSFADFARYVCAFRENPLRVYSHDLGKNRVLSSRRVLTNSLLSFYVQSDKEGRYISYAPKGGKEESVVTNSTKSLSNYAPIVHLKSLPSSFVTNPKTIKDKFKPIEVDDLGSLARVTYDPEMPDEPDVTLFLFPHKKKWVIGYVTSVNLDETIYFFNYVILNEEPTKPFLQYSTDSDKTPLFTDKFQHGYSYLPVIKLKNSHKIFGLA